MIQKLQELTFNQSRLISYTKFYKIIRSLTDFALETAAVKPKMQLLYCQLKSAYIVISFWTFFKYLGNYGN